MNYMEEVQMGCCGWLWNSWLCLGLGILPISVGILTAATFAISYSIAVVLKHVAAGFPYISDTGTEPPESCIFGQLLNITAMLVAATVYVRYKQVLEYNHRPEDSGLLLLNKFSAWLGMFIALGMSLVANFQESSVIIVHVVGAFMCFGCGIIYGFLQTAMSYKMYPHQNSLAVCRVRLIILVFATLCFITSILHKVPLSLQILVSFLRKDFPRKTNLAQLCDIIFYYPTAIFLVKCFACVQGFVPHVVSTAAEWGMSICFILFFFTYIREFQKITMEAQIRLFTDVLSLPCDLERSIGSEEVIPT
ncbi:DNA damage-regulated autophagy modulator protein 2-like [Branchiostoma floridae]|uniref:DNA damage-regulated autophagy modulator protein 2-like n=1 Tax=Branchiostoma floridae TaxID=7739 RepID=A0A9J7KZ55_BRAFL|nr:DNA damage-regulated autophagy modulator protein 2-like [Branchiostoma floridae]